MGCRQYVKCAVFSKIPQNMMQKCNTQLKLSKEHNDSVKFSKCHLLCRPSLACLRTVTTGYILSACFVPGDRHVMVGLKSGHMLIVDIASGDVLEDVPAHDNELWSVCLLPDQV